MSLLRAAENFCKKCPKFQNFPLRNAKKHARFVLLHRRSAVLARSPWRLLAAQAAMIQSLPAGVRKHFAFK
jgi:hypothetical protein